jgi:GTPase SAR1 family protein
MNSPLLLACRRAAQDAEHHALRLGLDWSGYQPIADAAAAFRHECDAIHENRGLTSVTIAFVGPKNAGKTTLISLLLASDTVRASLNIGTAAKNATARPTWIASEKPPDLKRSVEDFIPCSENEFVPLGVAYAILDVPGLDENRSERSHLAIRALDHAQVKVLVIERSQLATQHWQSYLAKTDGAVIVPVITHTPRADDPYNALNANDRTQFEAALKLSLPTSWILPTIVMTDYDLEGAERTVILEQTRAALCARLRDAVNQRPIEKLAEPQITVRFSRFRKAIAALAAQHLPATALTLAPIEDELRQLPASAVSTLLGSDLLLSANIRGTLRSTLLNRTPVFVFPWRLSLAVSNLVHGATDRLPLALLGSPPSMLVTAWAAAKNLRDRRQFAEDMDSGLRRRVEAVLKDKLSRRLTDLERNLANDLNTSQASVHTRDKCSVRLVGLESLQTQSTELFHRVMNEAAPSSLVAWLLGVLGFAMFWSVLGQPLAGLYVDFFRAAEATLTRSASTVQAFPSGTGSMLATSALLALLPMSLLLLLSLTWLTRKSRVERCISLVRSGHQKLIKGLSDEEILYAELSEPQLDACRQLLRFDTH